MAEATHTSEVVIPLPGGGNRYMIVGTYQIDDAEEITTGLDNIEFAFFQSAADVAAAFHLCSAASISGGTITTSVGAVDDYADDTGKNFYGLIIGVKR